MKWLAALLLWLVPVLALAQSSPQLTTGEIPSAIQWNSFFTSKADANGGVLTDPTINGGSMSGTAINASSLQLNGVSVTPGSSILGTPNTWGGSQYFGGEQVSGFNFQISGGSISNTPISGSTGSFSTITLGGTQLGSAATQNVGTTGTVVPLLSGSNTWTGIQTVNKGLAIPNWSMDVRDFGAVCDGTTNDSAAFGLAIAAVGLTGGRVEVPATGHGCYLASGITVSSSGYSAVVLEGVAGTYFPGFADNNQSDWMARGSAIICGDTVNACVTENGNGTVIRYLTFWYNQPTPPSSATCTEPCTMTHNWTPTTYPYTILISNPQNFNAVSNVTIVNADNCIDLEGPSNGVGSLFTYFEHLNLSCFNSGIMLHQVDNPVSIRDVNFNILWYQASSDVLGYTEGDSTHTGHKVDLSLEYASAVHLSGVTFVQSMTGIYTANATVTNGLGALTFGAQALYGEGIYFIQDCQAMAVQNSSTILQGRFSDVSVNTDPQTSTTTQCGGYLPYAFNLNSNAVDFGVSNMEVLYANSIANIGGGTSGVFHVRSSRSANYAAYTNSAPAFNIAAGGALDIDTINEFLTTNASAGPHISGSGTTPANWPEVTTGSAVEGPSGTVRQTCYQIATTNGAASTNQWCWVDDTSNNFNLYRFNPTTGAFIDAPIGINGSTGVADFNDGIQVSTTVGSVGTTAGDNANAGSIGEVLSGSGTATLTTSTPASTASVTLTPGDWDVSCAVNFQPAGSTTSTILMVQINTSVALGGSSVSAGSLNVPVSAGVYNTVLAPVTRENITSNTTVYCVADATFATSTMGSAGFIRARRMR